MDLDFKYIIAECQTLVQRTGAVLLDFWHNPHKLSVQKKSDGTPATSADLAAHHLITEGLQAITAGTPILSEEGDVSDYSARSQWSHYWLVDPLDGTRGFIAHLEQFSINIALIVDHRPVFGMIYSPASETAYYAWQGGGAFKQIGAASPQRIQPSPKAAKAPWRIVLGQYSRGKRIMQLINNQCPFQLLHVNGSVKFGWLAEGKADIYPRLGPISEWDTAAGQCIVTESGGAVVDLHGRTLQYNRKASLLNPDFIAVADASRVAQWLEILSKEATS